jgi:hypothetical protein
MKTKRIDKSSQPPAMIFTYRENLDCSGFQRLIENNIRI